VSPSPERLFSRKLLPLWLLLFLCCGFVLNSGNVPLFDLDEGAFSEASREIIESGVWSATYLDGQPRYDKPILTYWLQATSVTLFGLNEFALRLHSMVFALLWAVAVGLFCRQFINRRSAAVAVMIFSSTLLITMIGRAATADAVLNCFIALTLFDIYRYQRSDQRQYLWRSWLWLSLGMLTKGPVAAGIPLLVSGIWFFSLGEQQRWFKAIFNPKGWAILLMILSPWLYFIWQEQGSGFFYGFLVDHNFNRFTETREGHGGQWFYYFVLLPIGLLPYSGILLTLATRLRQLWSRPFERLLLIWFVVVFVLVSMSRTQLPHYVLYGVTPLIILCAKYRQLIRGQFWQLIFPASFIALQIGLYIYSRQLPDPSANAYMQEMLANASAVFNTPFLLAIIALSAALLFLSFYPCLMWKKLVAAGLLQTLFCYFLLIPAIGQLQQQPVKNAGLLARDISPDFVAHKINMPSFSVYHRAITERRAASYGDYVFTRSDKLADLRAQFGPEQVQLLYRQGGIVLLKIGDAK